MSGWAVVQRPRYCEAHTWGCIILLPGNGQDLLKMYGISSQSYHLSSFCLVFHLVKGFWLRRHV